MAISAEQFRQFTPFERGYAVYWFGNREDEPNVPSESNPYPVGTQAHIDWQRGQVRAAILAQDGEE